MLHIAVGYDYELFLGGSCYTEEEVLLQPATELMKLYDELKVCFTFFADVCSLMRYRQLGMNEFPDRAEAQLRNALQKGYDVQLHIHPQWLIAEKAGDRWVFEEAKYRLHAFTEHDPCWTKERVINESIEYLNHFMQQADPEYTCAAYRAGGFSVQPEEELLPLLAAKGIIIDSSVIGGGCSHALPQQYDFRSLPDVPGWWFDPAKGYNHYTTAGNGMMFEVPVLGVRPGRDKLWLKSHGRQFSSGSTKGFSAGKNCGTKWEILTRKAKSLMLESCPLSFDNWDVDSLMWMVRRILKGHNINEEELYVSVLGHPKLQNEELLLNTSRFIERIQKEYGTGVKFETMRQVGKGIIGLNR